MDRGADVLFVACAGAIGVEVAGGAGGLEERFLVVAGGEIDDVDDAHDCVVGAILSLEQIC